MARSGQTYAQAVAEVKARGGSKAEIQAVERAFNRARGRVGGYEAAQAIGAVGGPKIKGGETYTVQGGDNYYSLAQQFFGDDRYFEAIMAANPGVDILRPGVRLKIPNAFTNQPPSVSYAGVANSLRIGQMLQNAGSEDPFGNFDPSALTDFGRNALAQYGINFTGAPSAQTESGTPPAPTTAPGNPPSIPDAGLRYGQIGDIVRPPVPGGTFMQTGAGGRQVQPGLRGEAGGQSSPYGSGVPGAQYANSQQLAGQNFQQQTSGAGFAGLPSGTTPTSGALSSGGGARGNPLAALGSALAQGNPARDEALAYLASLQQPKPTGNAAMQAQYEAGLPSFGTASPATSVPVTPEQLAVESARLTGQAIVNFSPPASIGGDVGALLGLVPQAGVPQHGYTYNPQTNSFALDPALQAALYGTQSNPFADIGNGAFNIPTDWIQVWGGEIVDSNYARQLKSRLERARTRPRNETQRPSALSGPRQSSFRPYTMSLVGGFRGGGFFG